MKLIAYKNLHDCDVEFQDEYKYVFEHAIYNNFRQGKVKNPYDKTVCGVGMLGIGKYKARYDLKDISRDYKSWKDMLIRCYKNAWKYPAYHGIVTVCDEWLNFQNFAKWYEDNYYEIPDGERLHIDKDILKPGKMMDCLMALDIPTMAKNISQHMAENI